MVKQIFASVAPVCAFARCGSVGEVSMDSNHQHLLRVKRAALAGKEITADGEKFLWKVQIKHAQGPRSWDRVVWLLRGWRCFTRAWSLLVRKVPSTSNGRSKGWQSQHTPALRGLTCDVISYPAAPHAHSLAHTLAFPCKGQPEHAFSDHISVQYPPAPMQLHVVLHAPCWYRGRFSPPTWPHETEHPPLRKGMRLARGSFALKKTKSLPLDVMNQDGELMSAEVTQQGKTLTNYEGRCQFQVTCFP